MGKVLIGVIGEDSDAVEVMFKSFSYFVPDTIIALVKKGNERKMKALRKEADKFSIKVIEKEVSKFLELEEVFNEIKHFSKLYKKDSIVINVDCDYMSSCLALSSAFVNGILAIGILKDKLISYPIMKFSYYSAINSKKMELLHIIRKEVVVDSMEKLSQLSKLSMPLIAYHLRGNKDSEGLIEMNLVGISRENGKVKIFLTELGNLITNDAIDVPQGKVKKCHN